MSDPKYRNPLPEVNRDLVGNSDLMAEAETKLEYRSYVPKDAYTTSLEHLPVLNQKAVTDSKEHNMFGKIYTKVVSFFKNLIPRGL